MKLLKRIVLFLAIIIFSLSAYKVASYFLSSMDNKKAYKNISKEYKAAESIEETSNLDLLKEKNENIVAWLDVPSTNINYPVVKGSDNDFYLTHDMEDKKSIHGSIFMDYRNLAKDDRNLVIYGHYMKDGTMFKDLINYKEETFFKDNPDIFVDLGGEKERYEIFSVVLTTGDSGYIDIDFSSEESFLDYIDNIKAKSLFTRDIDFKGGEKIVTLSTCSYEFHDARTVVFGVKR
nr:class B sortase [Tissierella sp.]